MRTILLDTHRVCSALLRFHMVTHKRTSNVCVLVRTRVQKNTHALSARNWNIFFFFQVNFVIWCAPVCGFIFIDCLLLHLCGFWIWTGCLFFDLKFCFLSISLNELGSTHFMSSWFSHHFSDAFGTSGVCMCLCAHFFSFVWISFTLSLMSIHFMQWPLLLPIFPDLLPSFYYAIEIETHTPHTPHTVHSEMATTHKKWMLSIYATLFIIWMIESARWKKMMTMMLIARRIRFVAHPEYINFYISVMS